MVIVLHPVYAEEHRSSVWELNGHVVGYSTLTAKLKVTHCTFCFCIFIMTVSSLSKLYLINQFICLALLIFFPIFFFFIRFKISSRLLLLCAAKTAIT